jgi:hypothetical protein
MSFITFKENGTSPSGKTKRWVIDSKNGGPQLGTIQWYAPWRKYVCEVARSLFDEGCLREIAEFIEAETRAHRLKVQVEALPDE